MPFALLLAATLSFGPEDARAAYRAAGGFMEKCPVRDAGTPGTLAASYWILDEASRTGADARRDVFRADTPKGMRTFVNVCAEYRFDSDAEWVVLVSHYDTKPGCPGANDGASTTALLIAIADALGRWHGWRCNIMLLWTDGEECMEMYSDDDGLWGSRRAVETISARGLKIRAVVCLDMLGDRDLGMTIPKNATPELVKIALAAAKEAGAEVKKVPEVVKDDHVPFLAAGYKAIDIIDFDYGSESGGRGYWHTAEDTMDKISEESLLCAGKLVVEMLKILLR